MKRYIYLLKITAAFFVTTSSFAGTFTSRSNGGGAWNGGAAVWTIVGDADNLIDADDDVTIMPGDVITWGATYFCDDLTIGGTITGSVAGAVIYVNGNYVLTGTENGTGQFVFRGVNKTLTATGTLGFNFPRWFFFTSRTILSPSVITKTIFTYNGSNVTITNQGTVTLNSATTTTGSTWINDVGSTLSLTIAGFMTGRTFTASALNNTVRLTYATGAIPTTTGSSFYNLTLASAAAGAKTLPAAITVANQLTINASNTLNSNGFNLIVGGNWSNAGTFTAGAQTVTFNGTSTVSGGSVTSFNNVTISGTLTGHATNMNVAGNWVNNGTFTHNSGRVTFNGTSTVSGASTTTFNNVTVSGTLTGHATNMNVAGSFTNNGTFNNNSGTVTFNGGAAQTLSGTAATTFENLTISNTLGGVSISSGSYLLNGVLTMNSGNFNTNGFNFTMVSNALQTARIAPIVGGSISGNFIIQRHITTRDTTWADFSSPVQSTTFADWAAELPAISYYAGGPTQYTYDETADDWIPITAAGTALNPGQGFEVYLSGDYSFANFPASAINTVGVPNQGDQSFGNPIVSFNNAGSNLVGNPFASPISWDLVLAASSGLSGTIDMFDYASGNYATFGGGTIIPSTQGFWVYANAAPTLNIPESAKVADPGNTQIRSVKADPYFTLTLANNDSKDHFYHVIKIDASSNASDGWDNTDHPYRRSPNKLAPSIYSMIEGKKSVINTFNIYNEAYSIPLNTQVGTSGNYKIEAAGFENISEYTSVKLEDRLLNKVIDLTKESEYSFDIKQNDNPERFIVHFNKNKDASTTGVIVNEFSNQIEVLPSAKGNMVNFNLSETTNAVITVSNILGQPIAEVISLAANNQSVNVDLPESFHGMYIIRIESEKGTVNKKFTRK